MAKLAKVSLFSFLVLSLTIMPFVGLVYADETVSISATVGSVATPPPSSSGPGGVVIISVTAVRFSGYAYPGATVYLLKEGKEQTKVVADNLGAFNITLPEAYNSTILYTLFAVDLALNKSLLLNYPIVVYGGYVTYLSGIRFAPTVLIDKSEVNFADSINVSGYATPNANLEVVVIKKDATTEKKIFTIASNEAGFYTTAMPVLGYSKGEYTLYVKYKDEVKFSKTLTFTVGDTTKLNTDSDNIPGDCNFDNNINLVDFSILAFWYKKPNPPVCVDTNQDKIINLIDFSILAFYWNG
ncbi:MAG: hypothetical protein M3Q34_02450 [bacterium]|nr:hypothetical protein [bacterium]